MIDYNLAFDLRQAGFPQEVKQGKEMVYLGFSLYYPTLDELIEACGDNFFHLSGGIPYEGTKKWLCRNNIAAVVGSTAEEAVCRLWLALNEKK